MGMMSRPGVVAIVVSAIAGAQAGPPVASAETGERLFGALVQTVRENFHDPELNGVDWDALTAEYRPRVVGAASPPDRAQLINEMLGALRTSHTEFLTPRDQRYYQLLDVFKDGRLSQEIGRLFPKGQVRYTGMGAFVTNIDGKTFVKGVLAGFPADLAGLQVGDQVLSADGKPFHPIASFAGKRGEAVRLRVQSAPDPDSARDVVVTPTEIRPAKAFLTAQAHSVRIISRGGKKIGYMHIWSYAGQMYHELLKLEVTSGRLKDADALILDLRDGLGGANPEYLNLFNRNVPVLRMVRRGGAAHTWDTQWRRPAVLLVNGGTTSGKEIFAYGFKKHRMGKIVGTRTAGAVVAGSAFLLPGDNLLYLAVADVTVDGERLEGVGVEPDVEVSFRLPYCQGRDPQLERALELLAKGEE